MSGIPKKLSHIWIGPYLPPQDWMKSWQDLNPDWEYRVFDNEFFNNRRWRCQPLIDEYMKRASYSGVADLMRYEMLFEEGGLIASADSICQKSVSDLFPDPTAYTVYENEFLRGKLVSPVLACEPGNTFVAEIVKILEKTNPKDLLEPWKSTGNLLMARLIEKFQPDITIFPSHYFNPTHFEGLVYDGDGPVYAKQLFGSTTGKYQLVNKQNYFTARKIRKYRKEALHRANIRQPYFHLKDL